MAESPEIEAQRSSMFSADVFPKNPALPKCHMEFPPAALVEKIHASGRQMVLSITGGGTGAIAEILSVPGGSRTLLAAEVPYSQSALAEWLGGQPDHYCTEATARAMAMAAWKRAQHLAPDAATENLLGVGTTASLVSHTPKRGEHRVHVAVQTSRETLSSSLVLEKNQRTRPQEEQVASTMVVAMLAMACDVEESLCHQTLRSLLVANERIERHTKSAPPAWSELLTSNAGFVPEREIKCNAIRGVFPGAFNPLHVGHRRMAQLADERLGFPVHYELSIANVDKPPLDFVEIDHRLGQIRRDDPQRSVLLSAAPTFVAKAELWPGCTFVVGADTIVRIGDPRYYAQDESRRNAAVARIRELGCQFLVFGRQWAGSFHGLSHLSIPASLREICQKVGEADFRADISSTSLRRG